MRRNSMSSFPISYPAITRFPASILASIASLSPSAIPCSTAGKSWRHFAPKDLRLGTTSIFWNRSKSFSKEMISTFNSSARISWNADKSGPLTIQPSAHGSLCLRSASTLILRPVSASSLTSAIVSMISESTSPASGQSAICTDSPTKFLWIASDMNGETGAISRETVTNTVWRVC